MIASVNRRDTPATQVILSIFIVCGKRMCSIFHSPRQKQPPMAGWNHDEHDDHNGGKWHVGDGEHRRRNVDED